MHSATIMSFFVINNIIRFMRMHAPIYAPISHIHKESVKSVHSSRSTRASQSPNKVEKQPKSTPDMYNPPHPLRAWSGYDISTRTFIVVVRTLFFRMLRRFCRVANNVNKRLLCHRFFTLSVPAKFVDLSKFAAKVRLFFDICKENRNFLMHDGYYGPRTLRSGNDVVTMW